ncbi:hypothetical protein SAY86_008780 [Trapa natans]|uniref:Probable 6-phosphogluconolactonase n=1 Tax=Trapa natans TaxID=22666 RepID=A0AAN7KFZ0_TRANT|nr:hypothetical protein SAY86_008780 [Trapa natans]
MAFSRVRHNDRGELRVYDGSDDLAINLAEYIAELSEASVRDHGVFSVALSGGSLISLMRKLCEAPYNMTVDWARWHIFWADERVVSKSHSDSNYKLAKDVLLSKVPVVPSHIHSINDTVSAEEAANDYEFVIRQLVRTRTICVSDIHDCPKFDLILLGMGSDGHVASLFPGHESLGESNEWVTFLTDAPKPPHERITFTLPVINSASNIAIVVTGQNKARGVQMVMMGGSGTGYNCPALPAQMVSPTSGNLMWFLDSSAASKLDGTWFSK